MQQQVEGQKDGDGAGGQAGGENGEAAETEAGGGVHEFGALTFLRPGRGKVAARRAAADRAGLGRLARRLAALIEAPQCGQRSGALGVRGVLVFMRLLSFGLGVNGEVFGGSENGLELAEDHDDQAGRVLGQEAGEDVAGDLFGLLVAHMLAAAAGAGDVPAPGCGGQGLAGWKSW